MQNELIHNSKRAKARWKLLAHALKQQTSSNLEVYQHSVRRFAGFNLFDVKKVTSSEVKAAWYQYSVKGDSQGVKIRVLNVPTTAAELIGFNNTGNVCIWPSEEILATYCIKHKDLFLNKSVCELGGGMTSLAGLQVALHTKAKSVVLTDGNTQSVENLEVIATENKSMFEETNLSVRQLVWSSKQEHELRNSFDVVICADCLFFVNVHLDLVHTITNLLKRNGICIIFAPKRSETLLKFVESASVTFEVIIEEKYDDEIWSLHEELKLKDDLYSPDIHYPILVKMWIRDMT